MVYPAPPERDEPQEVATLTVDGRVLRYAGLEPILVPTGTPTDVTFTLTSGDDTATLSQSGLNLTLSGATFESTIFLAPTGSLTIDGGDGEDSVTIAGTMISAQMIFSRCCFTNGRLPKK